jgi:surfeit locus 1 family protein
MSRAAEKRQCRKVIGGARGTAAAGQHRAGGSAGATPARMHRRVSLRGRWLEQHTVYLDNRQMDGKPGFYLLTPLQLDGMPGSVVLVQRGWLQRNFIDRSQRLPAGRRRRRARSQVSGRIASAPPRQV